MKLSNRDIVLMGYALHYPCISKAVELYRNKMGYPYLLDEERDDLLEDVELALQAVRTTESYLGGLE